MFAPPNPNSFGQSSRSPFTFQSAFGQTCNTSNSPSAPPMPFGSTTLGFSSSPVLSSTTSGARSFSFPQRSASMPFASTNLFRPQTGCSSVSTPAFRNTTVPASGASCAPAISSYSNPNCFGQSSRSPFVPQSVFDWSKVPFVFDWSKLLFGQSSTTPFGQSSTAPLPAFGASSTPGCSVPSSPIVGFWLFVPIGPACIPAFGSSNPASGASSTPSFSFFVPPASGQSNFTCASSQLGVSSPCGAQRSPSGQSGFGQKLVSVPFGSIPTQTSPFGSTTQLSQPASQSSICGSSMLFGGSSQPAFCATATPFGATTTPAFGDASTTPDFSAIGSSQCGASSPFGAQSSQLGAQSTAFGNTGFRQSAFGGQQRGGSRVAAHTETPEPDGGSGAAAGKLESISAMQVYKDKIHEEIRWEDYQLGDKGGPAPAGGSGFGVSTSQPNPLNTAPSLPQASSSPFNTRPSFNIFAPKTPSFSSTGFGTSSTPFGSSIFGISTSSNLFPQSSSVPVFGQTSSPSLFSSSSTSAFSFSAPAQTSNSTFNAGPLFGAQSTTFGNTAFGQSAFGGQQFKGSRVALYSETSEEDYYDRAMKLESLSAVQVYKDKSHEELRWEDYQLGDKGGPAPPGGGGIGTSTSQPNPLNTAPSFPLPNPLNHVPVFAQAPSSVFNTLTLFAPQTPSFTATGFGASSAPFTSSTVELSTSPNIFTPPPPSSVLGQTSSPSLSSSSAMPSSTFAFPVTAQTPTSAFYGDLSTPIPFRPVRTTASSAELSTTPFGPTDVSHRENFPLEEKRRLRMMIERMHNLEKNGRKDPSSSCALWP